MTVVNDWLFGKNLAEDLKTAKLIDQSAEELKVKKQSQSGPKNYKGPPRHSHKNHSVERAETFIKYGSPAGPKTTAYESASEITAQRIQEFGQRTSIEETLKEPTVSCMAGRLKDFYDCW